LGLENFPQKSQNVQFFHFGSKKISSGWIKKFLGQRRVTLFLVLGQKYARIGPGPISTLAIKGKLFKSDWESFFYLILANRAPALPGKNLMSLRHPSGHFTLHKGFRVWSTPGFRGRVGEGHACVKNLPRVGGEVCAKFGGDWSGGSCVKRGHR